jgi:hypothetical protein
MAMSQLGKTYGWGVDQGTLKVKCFKSSDDTQIITKNNQLASAARLTPSHDEALQQATKEINAILARVMKANKDPNRQLSFLRIPTGLFLAWTEDGVSARDDEHTVNKALGIE